MNSSDQIHAEQVPEGAERMRVLVLEHTKTADHAAKYGLLHARVDIEPKAIKTYFGDLLITEAWLERRPHPAIREETLGSGDKKKVHLTKEHLLLCLRHRALTVEEKMSCAWFTSGEEWGGFSTGDVEVRHYRFWDGEPSKLTLTVMKYHDVDLSGTKPRLVSGRGIVQILLMMKNDR